MWGIDMESEEMITEGKKAKRKKEKLGVGKEILNIFSSVFKLAFRSAFLLICSCIATFFIAIFKPEGVVNAIEIFKNLFA